MSVRVFDTFPGRRAPGAAGLGALLLGLLAAPWVYVTLFGALSAFPLPFAAVVTPLLLGATLQLTLEAYAYSVCV